MNFDAIDPEHSTDAEAPFDWGAGVRRGFRQARRRHGRHGHRGFDRVNDDAVQSDVLATLAEGPRNGYEIMLAVEEQRGLRPSASAVYPVLQMLEDGDFVNSGLAEGKRVYSITEAGRELLRANPPAAHGEHGPGAELALRGLRTVHGLRDAARAIARSGDGELIARGVEILDRARRELHSLLAQER